MRRRIVRLLRPARRVCELGAPVGRVCSDPAVARATGPDLARPDAPASPQRRSGGRPPGPRAARPRSGPRGLTRGAARGAGSPRPCACCRWTCAAAAGCLLPGFAGHPARRGRLLVGACVLRPAPACCCSRVCSLPRALSNPTPLPRSRCVCCSASLTVGVLGCAELETSAGGRCAYFCCPCRSLQTELVDFARRLGFCETPLRAPDLHPAPLRPRSGAQPARRPPLRRPE